KPSPRRCGKPLAPTRGTRMCRAPRELSAAKRARRFLRATEVSMQMEPVVSSSSLYAAIVILALAACDGCASPESGKRTLKLHEWQEPHVARAPHTGKYDVAYRVAGTSELVHERYTTVSVQKGDSLGFREDRQRGLIAVAGKREFVLGERSPIADY